MNLLNQTSELRLSSLMKPYWSRIEMREALDSITIVDIRNLSREFTSALYVEGLVHGNMTPKVRYISNLVSSFINFA